MGSESVDIRYVTRSQFLQPIVNGVNAGRSALESGRSVLVQLKPGGYRGAYTVTIDQGRRTEFRSTASASDITRFPVRIRAAVTALRDCGYSGSFRVSHDDGVIQIRRA